MSRTRGHAALLASAGGAGYAGYKYEHDEGMQRSAYFWSRVMPMYLHYRWCVVAFARPWRHFDPLSHPHIHPGGARAILPLGDPTFTRLPSHHGRVQSKVQHLPDEEQVKTLQQMTAPTARSS
jgi:hypothetical protein